MADSPKANLQLVDAVQELEEDWGPLIRRDVLRRARLGHRQASLAATFGVVCNDDTGSYVCNVVLPRVTGGE
jgi:hypothetical protein